MNIDLLASLSGNGFLNTRTTKEPGLPGAGGGTDFLSMLKSRINNDESAYEQDYLSKDSLSMAASQKQFAFTGIQNSFDPDSLTCKPCEGHEKPDTFRSELHNSEKANMESSRKNEMAGSRKEVRSETEKPKEKVDNETHESKLKSAIEKLEELLKGDEAANADLSELILAVPAEVLADLMESMNEINPEELQVLLDNPQELEQQLLAVLQQHGHTEAAGLLENSENSEAFAELLRQLSDIMSLQQQSKDTAEPIIAIEVDESNILSDSESSQALEKLISAMQQVVQGHNQNGKAAESAKESESTMAASDEAKATLKSEADALQESDSSSDKIQPDKAKGDSTENIVQEVKAEENAEQSLRSRFQETNKVEETAAETSVETTGDDSSDVNLTQNSANRSTAPEAAQSPAKTNIEMVAEKFFNLLSEKTTTRVNGKAESATYGNGGELKRPGFSQSGNNNGSSGHGFSSGQGNLNSVIGNAKPGAAAPANNMMFAEMLEKAEYLKTQNGSKILNIELDPDQLGKIEMELVSKDGTITARLSAASDMAKARLEELAPQIKEQLENQGVNLSQITVDISSKNPDERSSNQMGGRKNKSGRVSATDSKDAESIIRKNILPNLRRAALNIKAVDVTV